MLIVAITLAAAPVPDYIAFSQYAKTVAIAATSAGTCPSVGVQVDREGLGRWAEKASSEGVYGGIDESMANMILADALKQERANLEVLADRAKDSTGDRREFERFRDYWARRCSDLANNPETSPYFSQR
jgi:hypothetical protein